MHGNNHPQKSREKLVDARLLKKMPIGKAVTGRVMNWDVYTLVHKACGYIAWHSKGHFADSRKVQILRCGKGSLL